MKRFLILLIALLIMQIIIGYNAKAEDIVWMKETHYNLYVEFAPNSNLLLTRGSHGGESRKGVIIFNTDGDTIKVIYNSEGLEFISSQGILDAHFSRDGRFLVVIWLYDKDHLSHGMLEIFETENWTSIKKIEVPGDEFSLLGAKVLISPDNRTVVGITQEGFYFYDVHSGELLKYLDDFGQDMTKNIHPYKGFYSSDGQYVYFNASDNKLRFLNTQTYLIEYTRQDQSDNKQYGKLAVSKNGTILANDAGVNELRVINSQNKETILSIPVYTVGISGLAFTNDEKYLGVSFGYSEKINIYDIQTGEIIKSFTDATFGNIDFSYDDKYIITTLGQYLVLLSNSLTSVNDNKTVLPNILYPNPTNGSVNIKFDNKFPSIVNITVYDETGKLTKKLFTGHLDNGDQNINVDVSGLKSGNYLVKVSAPGTDITFKLIINK